MINIEPGVVKSFRLVKNDVVRLQSDLLCLSQTQERIVEHINKLKARIDNLSKSTGHKVKHKTYVASKNSDKFHIPECPFAKNIKPKSRINFLSRVKALNKGLTPCRCST